MELSPIPSGTGRGSSRRLSLRRLPESAEPDEEVLQHPCHDLVPALPSVLFDASCDPPATAVDTAIGTTTANCNLRETTHDSEGYRSFGPAADWGEVSFADEVLEDAFERVSYCDGLRHCSG
jgi:hypothetical protein